MESSAVNSFPLPSTPSSIVELKESTSTSNSTTTSRPQTPKISRSTSTKSITPIQFHHHLNSPQKLLRRITIFSNKISKRKSLSSQNSETKLPSRKNSVQSIDTRELIAAQISTSSEFESTSRWLNLKNERRSIKIRIVTFNMAESLPTGDLSEFLGEIEGRWKNGKWLGEVENLPQEEEEDERLPQYPLTTSHPYHLIVVCGQETPTASGIMGGKIRNIDSKGWTSILEESLCTGGQSSEIQETSSLHSNTTTSKHGPYVLVEKERLMGLFIAIFVSSNCNSLVAAVSKAKISAGLLGGRIGNKGAVGISINFAGSRIAFISAHLAAHAKNLEIRKQNVRKILSELELDDFVGNQDGLELSERFDQTFFVGDLNFRLAVSRLHADFILKSQDYPTALLFDQLREVLLEENSPFEGFQEASIHFAPTFKYDIVRPKYNKSSRHKTPASPTLPPPLQIDSDTVSIGSNSSASDFEQTGPDFDGLSPSTASEAIQKAKVKFLTLRAKSLALSKNLGSPKNSHFSPDLITRRPSTPTKPILRASKSYVDSKGGDTSSDEGEVRKPATFDTSAKQRVQSYTDRILFRSTVSTPVVQPSPPVTSRTLGFVDSLKNLVSSSVESTPNITPTSTHTYFEARPVLPHPSKSVGSTAHSSNVFGRHAHKSTESLVSNTKESNTLTDLSRARSVNTGTTSPRSLPKIDASSETASSVARARSYSAGQPATTSTIPTDPAHVDFTEPYRTSNNHNSFPRSLTRTSARTVNNHISLNRVKSFFHFNLPLPSFLLSTNKDEVALQKLVVQEQEKVGPKKGEIEVIKYDAIADLERMGATSDHRPVYLVCAIGIGED